MVVERTHVTAAENVILRGAAPDELLTVKLEVKVGAVAIIILL